MAQPGRTTHTATTSCGGHESPRHPCGRRRLRPRPRARARDTRRETVAPAGRRPGRRGRPDPGKTHGRAGAGARPGGRPGRGGGAAVAVPRGDLRLDRHGRGACADARRRREARGSRCGAHPARGLGRGDGDGRARARRGRGRDHHRTAGRIAGPGDRGLVPLRARPGRRGRADPHRARRPARGQRQPDRLPRRLLARQVAAVRGR